MIKCPVCEQYIFEEHDDFDSCEICHWQNDGLQTKEPSYWGGANELCLYDYKHKWLTNRQAQAV